MDANFVWRNGAAWRDRAEVLLDSKEACLHRSVMKLKEPHCPTRKKATKQIVAKRRRPSVAEWAKRVSGMMNGPRDLSSREGLGR